MVSFKQIYSFKQGQNHQQQKKIQKKNEIKVSKIQTQLFTEDIF